MNLYKIITGKLSRMSYVNRYSSFHANRRENVAEHSWWVAVISYFIALELRAVQHVDMQRLLERALMHDISEVVSGDVIRSYKHGSPEILKAMQDADYENTYDMTHASEFGAIDMPVFDAWQYSKDTTIEGQIVEFADQAAVAFYCREEDRSGNRSIRPVLKQAYETWFNRYHDHPLFGKFIDQMFPTKVYLDMFRNDDGPPQRPMTVNYHNEGPTSEFEALDWPSRGEVPLG